MLRGHRIIGLIPARGGSRRLRRKNVRPFAGKPMLAWTVEAARESGIFDRLVLSSEDDEIMDVARRHGCEVPFRRPAELATSEADSMDVVIHALETLDEREGYLVLLQPTSPLRTAADIVNCVQTCIERGASSCVSVSPLSKPPAFMALVTDDGRLRRETPLANLQDRPCIINGAVYAARIDLLLKRRTFYFPDTCACMMPHERSLDIDEEYEFIMAEALMRARISGWQHGRDGKADGV